MRQLLVCTIAWVLAAAAPGAIARAQCPAISGFDQYVSHARGVFVADMHGTVEAPTFLSALVCNLSHSGHAIVLGLEYPSAEQHFITEYLQERTDTAEPKLLSTPFWSRPVQDGRTSQAMLNLLHSIREQIRMGARIRVIAFDAPVTGSAKGAAGFDARDQAMAERLRQQLSSLHADEVPLIFTGNVHARKMKGLTVSSGPPGMENAEPLGYRLRDLGFTHMNIDTRGGGSLWTCFSPTNCGVQEMDERGPAVSSYSIVPSPNPAYDLIYVAGPLTASAPAISSRASLPSRAPGPLAAPAGARR